MPLTGARDQRRLRGRNGKGVPSILISPHNVQPYLVRQKSPFSSDKNAVLRDRRKGGRGNERIAEGEEAFFSLSIGLRKVLYSSRVEFGKGQDD